ncbi:cyclin-domain-containing protein [Chaetomium tenue]|uniref:Cyclin-domain-containing protein n=1 Tax=Chaetomium tenue TaxID=1854479 RepID=A0ACB7P9U0_9PEZI|nr:cyclin-domain-containing protein [Chaetomium globosum]
MAEQQSPQQSTSGRENGNGNDSNPVHSPPPAPVASADPGLQGHARSDHTLSPATVDHGDETFEVSPEAALKLLSAGIEALVSMTGDIPPTPPPMSPTIPHMRGMDEEKVNIVRSNSEKNLARLAQRTSAATSPMPGSSPLQHVQSASDTAEPLTTTSQPQEIDGVRLRTTKPEPAAAPTAARFASPQTPPPSNPPPTQSPQPLVPYIIVGENSQPVNVQHSAIARKFYCRVPPPVSVTEYLRRVHDYCPLSAGVYLATSLYIHRLAVLERAIVVTKRNAHRLVLAGLRVAMKALEDLYYPHRIIARVGGISEKELARLEISFCFLTSFDLAVDASMLEQHWELLRRGPECWSVLEEELRQQDRGFVSFVKAPAENGAEAQA